MHLNYNEDWHLAPIGERKDLILKVAKQFTLELQKEMNITSNQLVHKHTFQANVVS